MNYDSGYHFIFSNPKLIEDLMCHFVPETWVKQLDFSSLHRVNTKFHSDGLTRREGDIIYRIHLNNGDPVYLYLLLEFQSRSDPWMAVRVGTYVFLLYQHLIKEKQISTKTGLPPVFPLVLYNGDTPWNASIDLKDLIICELTAA